MESHHLAIIHAEITRELKSIDKLLISLNRILVKVDLNTISEIELRGIGSILHDFYTAIERIFRKIAQNLDGELPLGDNWHTQLLDRMTLIIPNLRTAVISISLKEKLNDYLRFRHIFRNIYGYELQTSKMEPLINHVDEVSNLFFKEMNEFLKWIKKLDEK